MPSSLISRCSGCMRSHSTVLQVQMSAHKCPLVFAQPFAPHTDCQQAMSNIPPQDPCRDTRNDVSACSSSHSAMPAGLSYHIEESTTYGMVEKGAQLTLQQHLHHYGVLTVSEQQRWKQPIITALRSKLFNNGSKYFLEKLRTPFKEEFKRFLLLPS